MNRRAFTLIELLVVIAIIGLLSTIAVMSLNSSRMNARNTTRKANLVQISKALELYYSDNNAYPNTGGFDHWHGACTSYGPYTDTGVGAWIPNFGAYMAQLPRDPNTNKGNPTSSWTTGNPNCLGTPGYNCYLYASNGIDYKLLAHCTPEGPVSTTDPFFDPVRTSGGQGYAYQISTPNATTGW